MDKEITKTITITYDEGNENFCSESCEQVLDGYCILFDVCLKQKNESKSSSKRRIFNRCYGCIVNFPEEGGNHG